MFNKYSLQFTVELYTTFVLSIIITSKSWEKRTVSDVTQFCVCCGRGDRTLTIKSIGWGHGPATTGAGNRSRVFAASMLTVLRPINLSVALAAG